MPDGSSRQERIADAARSMRVDLRLIADLVEPGARVLDIGCGDGALIGDLFRSRGCDARGIELDMALVTRAVAHGLPVMQGDADTDLAHYPDEAFDYVVLSRTLQAVERPWEVLRQMLRIGARAIVSFPNFGHWSLRCTASAARPDADDRRPGAGCGTRRPTSTPARSATSSRSVKPRAMSSSNGSRWTTRATARPGGDILIWPIYSVSRVCLCCGGARTGFRGEPEAVLVRKSLARR